MANVYLTLADLANSGRVGYVESELIHRFGSTSKVLGVMPVVEDASGILKWMELTTLPTPQFVGVNDAVAEADKFDADAREVSSSILEKTIGADDYIVRRGASRDAIAANIQTQALEMSGAFARLTETKVFDGDKTSDIREFDGFNAICTETSGTYQNVIDMGGTGSADYFDRKILRDLWSYTHGQPTHWVMGDTMWTEIQEDMEGSGLVQYQSIEQMANQFYVQPMLMGLPVLTTGKNLSGTDNLTCDETYDNETTCASIYSVNFNSVDGVHLFQEHPLEMTDILAPDADNRKYRARMNWALSVVARMPNAIVRARGILSKR